MTSFTQFLSQLMMDGSFMTTLLIAALKGFAILAAATLACVLLRHGAASLRHLCWSIAIVAVLALPLISIVMPSMSVPVLPGFAPAGHSAPGWHAVHSPDAIEARAAKAETSPLSAGESAAVQSPRLAPKASRAGDADKANAASEGFAGWEAAAIVSAADGGVSWPVLLLILWFLGAALILLHMLAGTVGVWRIVVRAQPVTDPAWLDLVDEIGDRLSIRRPVQLLRTPSIGVPMVWGVLRPVVLLPESADDWDDERRRCVLAHELAHVKRFDPLTQPFARIACALHWFNPLVWQAAHSMRLEREKACDDYVLQTARTKASNYASHLLEIARQIPTTFSPPVGGVAMARRSQLEGRVLSILEDRRQRSLPKASAALTIFFAILVVLPLAALRPVPVDVPATSATGIADPGDVTASEPIASAWYASEAIASVWDEPDRSEEPATSKQQSPQDVIKRSFSVSAGGWLRIDTDNGNIEVRTGDENRVDVEVHRVPRGRANVDDFQVHFDHSGSDVTIEGDGRNYERGNSGLNVRFVVSVPRKYNVELETSGGNISIEDLDGKAQVETAGGNLSFGRITGTIDAETSGGNISVDGSEGDVRVETSGGHIKLGRVGGRVEASTSGGNISVDGSQGDLQVETSGGNINLGRIGGTVQASTSGGNISVEEVNGDIDAETSGGNITARLAKQPVGPSRLRTAAGSITVFLADGVAVNLDAESHGGRVESDLPVSTRGEIRKDRLRGSINGGGPDLVLEGQDIRIRRF